MTCVSLLVLDFPSILMYAALAHRLPASGPTDLEDGKTPPRAAERTMTLAGQLHELIHVRHFRAMCLYVNLLGLRLFVNDLGRACPSSVEHPYAGLLARTYSPGTTCTPPRRDLNLCAGSRAEPA
jgi:hypothetical protein